MDPLPPDAQEAEGQKAAKAAPMKQEPCFFDDFVSGSSSDDTANQQADQRAQ